MTIARSQSVLSPDLIDAYRRTRYSVEQTPVGNFSLRIDHQSDALRQLLKIAGNHRSAAVITAYNPKGVLLGGDENRRRHNQLQDICSKAGWCFYEGAGVGEGLDEWPAEPSLLIVGIDERDAELLGRQFEQNAIVLCDIAKPASLRLLR